MENSEIETSAEHPIWETEILCKYCDIKFTVDATTVIYGDLRPPELFVADMQYYAICPQCESTNIVKQLPSHVAIWIQNRMFTPK